MKKRVLSLGILGLLATSVQAGSDPSGEDIERFAREQAKAIAGARDMVGKDAHGRVQWAGIRVEEQRVCDHGRLNDAGRRLLQEGQHFAQVHQVRLVVYTPTGCEQGVRLEAAAMAKNAEVRPNALIDNCHMVIAK